MKVFAVSILLFHLSFCSIIAFTDQNTCPEGWVPWNLAPCRVPIFQGSLNLANKRTVCPLFQTGGQFQHILTLQQLTIHDHKQGSQALYNFYGGGQVVGSRTYPGGGIMAYLRQLTSKTGGSKPFNVRDPYVVLRGCKKISETDLAKNFTAANQQIQKTNEQIKQTNQQLNKQILELHKRLTQLSEDEDGNFNLSLSALIIGSLIGIFSPFLHQYLRRRCFRSNSQTRNNQQNQTNQNNQHNQNSQQNQVNQQNQTRNNQPISRSQNFSSSALGARSIRLEDIILIES